MTALIGIVGALLGGLIGRTAGWSAQGEPVGFLMAVVGAVVLLALHRATSDRSRGIVRH